MPSLTFSMIVHQGNSAFSWNTKAMSCGSGPRTGLPLDLDRAGGRRQQAADHVEQRALAAAARPDQAEQLAARDIERGVLQRLHELRVARLAELMRDVPDLDRDVALISAVPRMQRVAMPSPLAGESGLGSPAGSVG